jgi:hypothetical protein
MSLMGLMFLICALVSAIFTVDRSPWEQGTFMTFLMLSMTAFVVSSLRRPSLLWAIIDDLNNQRQPRFHTQRAHSAKGQ